VAEPIRLRVPSLDVAATVQPLGLDADGVLEVPEEPEQVGWFSWGTAPGGPGAAVIAGHVDSRDGPAVFFELAMVSPGAEIFIDRADGTTATFRVERVVHHPKDELPIAEIYASTGPELRLITCGGEWDADTSSYRDNIVAYATLADSTA
jgi:sortase (surface protein transpeptidase)